MVWVVSHWPVTKESQIIQSQGNAGRICGGEVALGNIFSKQLYILQYSILIDHLGLTLYTHLRLQYQRNQLCPSPIVKNQKLYGTETAGCSCYTSYFPGRAVTFTYGIGRFI
jgi:hypothetical protein